MKDTKQVIIIRKDLKMRRGKEFAQLNHASLAFLTKRFKNFSFLNRIKFVFKPFKPQEILWMRSSYAKICLQVNSEQELLDLHGKAIQAGLESNLIQDSGRTEFHDIPTYTALAIGPDYVEKIDEITKNLKLY